MKRPGLHMPAEPHLNPRRFFTSRLHDERSAAILGVALGATFTTCFLTGMLSHLIQDPPGWFLWPSRPIGLYRFTQSLHVATGLASVPLLLAKLWVVLPKLFEWPPVRSIAHAAERLGLLALVGGSLFLLLSGVGNVARWRPWGFSFTSGHYWAALVAYGALFVHVGHKATVTRRSLRREAANRPTASAPPTPTGPEPALSRRGFLGTVAAASGVITLTTAGQTVAWLGFLNALGVRRPKTGPQGLPVNKTASGAGVLEAIESDEALRDFRLVVTGKVERDLELTLDDLRAMPQHDADLPIACVEGWSAAGRWRGVRVRDLLDRAGAAEDAEVRVESLQQRSLYSSSPLNRLQARDPLTTLALELNGEPLHPDHGRPVRLIGPNRPGVQQTKWVRRLVVS